MTTPTGILFADPRVKPISTTGTQQPGATLNFYLTGTTTPTNVYADGALTTTLSQPVTADSAGRFAAIYMDPAVTYRAIMKTSGAVTISDTDPYVVPQIGASLFPITAAETAAGLTVTNFAIPPYPINVLRYGVVPNSPSAATANTTILTMLFSPLKAGPTGLVLFPNTTGTDIYTINGILQIRDGCRIDFCESQISCIGTYSSAFDTFGFFTFIRDVTLQNGSINVNFNGTGGTNAGQAIRIGSRSGYAFGSSTGIFDQTDLAANGLPLQGNIRLSNLRITSNNPATNVVTALGGLRNMIFENIWIDGQNLVPFNGFYYEYGFATQNGNPSMPSLWSTSHAVDMRFTNIHVTNMKTGGGSQGFGMNGSYNSIIDGLYVSGADNGVILGAGEAFYYRPWVQDVLSPTRNQRLRNIVIMNCPAVAVSLQGAAVCGPGTLMYPAISALPAPAIYQAQTDFMNYSLDGFSFVNCNVGMEISGAQVDVRNGTITGNGSASSGGIIVSAETGRWTLDNVQVLNCGGQGVRLGISPAPIWSPARPTIFKIRNCKICGSTGIGISLTMTQAGLIENCQLGFNTLYDTVAETTQTTAIDLLPDCYGVRCSGNYTSTSGGAAAYASSNGAINAMNFIESERHLQSVAGSGHFQTDFQSPTAASVASSGTISIEGLRTIRVTTAAAVTAVILQAGYASGQEINVINESAHSITFAASGTSRVADGTSDIITATSNARYVWNSGTSLWYRTR